MLALVAMTGCSKWGASRSKEFKHTGCSAETRSATSLFYGDEPSLLTLKYENGDLRVIRTRAVMSCAIKERGLACTVSFKGKEIYYTADFEKDGYEVDCICPVDELSSCVTGLHEGEEYTFNWCGIDRYLAPVTFTFKKGLHQIIDVDTL